MGFESFLLLRDLMTCQWVALSRQQRQEMLFLDERMYVL